MFKHKLFTSDYNANNKIVNQHCAEFANLSAIYAFPNIYLFKHQKPITCAVESTLPNSKFKVWGGFAFEIHSFKTLTFASNLEKGKTVVWCVLYDFLKELMQRSLSKTGIMLSAFLMIRRKSSMKDSTTTRYFISLNLS